MNKEKHTIFSRRKFLVRTILIILGVILPLLVLELGSYFFGKFPVEPDPLVAEWRSQWAEFRTFDSLLFWKLKPNVSVCDITTNSLGLRDKEISKEKDNEFRILSLGESTTFGLWVRQEETYSAILEETGKSAKGKRLRVINAGQPGYTLFQGYMYLKHRGVKLRPDAVMIYFGHNDFLPVANLKKRDGLATKESEGLNDWELFQKRNALSWKVGYRLSRMSNFFRAIRSFRLSREIKGTIRASSDRVRVPHEQRKRLLRLFQAFCEERNIKFIIIVPWYLKFKKHIALLRKYAAPNNIPIIDLPKELKQLPRSRKRYFRDSTHPNPMGHWIIAEVISRELGRVWPDS